MRTFLYILKSNGSHFGTRGRGDMKSGNNGGRVCFTCLLLLFYSRLFLPEQASFPHLNSHLATVHILKLYKLKRQWYFTVSFVNFCYPLEMPILMLCKLCLHLLTRRRRTILVMECWSSFINFSKLSFQYIEYMNDMYTLCNDQGTY